MRLGANTKSFMQRLVDAQTDLFCFVSAMLPYCKSNVSDVVQETNRALIEHAEDYDPARPFIPWMLAFAKNQILCFRKNCQTNRLIFDEELVARSEQAFAEESATDFHDTPQAKRLALCLERLTARQRKLVALRYDQEQSMEEIAKKLGIRNPAVRASLFYVRKKLADCIARLCRTRADLEDAPLSDFDDALAALVEGEPTSLVQTESVVRQLKDSDENLRSYLEQMRIHALLSQRCLPGICKLPQQPILRKTWWKPLAAAAALAALAGTVLMQLQEPEPAQQHIVAVEAYEEDDDWLTQLTPLDLQAYEENMGFHTLRQEQEELRKYEPGVLTNPGIGIEILSLSAALEKKLLLIPSDYVRRSRLALDSGNLKFRLDSGAVITLFGPAEVTLTDKQSVILNRGMMVAESGTQGLSVALPEAVVHNRNVTFCAEVSSNRSADVLVLDGSLQMIADADGQIGCVTANEGVRWATGKEPVRFRCLNPGEDLKKKFLSGNSKIAMQKR